MRDLLCIKLGGSVITDKRKPFSAETQQIRRFAKEIKAAKKNFSGHILLAHGSGSFGHTVASKYQIQKGLIGQKSLKGLPLVAEAAIRINRIVIDNLLKEHLPTVSFSPASFIIADNFMCLRIFADPIVRALELGFLPVIYGDIVFDVSRGFCIFSAERTLGALIKVLAGKFHASRLIYCGDTDGVYDAEGHTIKRITPESFHKYRQAIDGAHSIDVTGGMSHKVQESLALAQQFGVRVSIINGRRNGLLKRAIEGVNDPSGTVIEKVYKRKS